MAKIHGIVYIIIGIIVTVISSTSDKLIVFFYVGSVFILIGVIKLFVNYTKKKMGIKEKPSYKKHYEALKQKHQMQQHLAKQPAQHQTQPKQHYKRCMNCGNIARIHDRFCSKCGARV